MPEPPRLVPFSTQRSSGSSPSSLWMPELLVNKTLRFLNSFTGGSNSLPTRNEQSTAFQQRAFASDLEVLSLTSHSTANGLKELHGAASPWAHRRDRQGRDRHWLDALLSRQQAKPCGAGSWHLRPLVSNILKWVFLITRDVLSALHT